MDRTTALSKTSPQKGPRVTTNLFFNLGVLASVIYLGSQPGMRTTENALFSLLVIPILTFSIAAPRRIRLFDYVQLIKTEALYLGLRIYSFFTQTRLNNDLLKRFRAERIHSIYDAGGNLSRALEYDKAGLQHARRLGHYAALFGTITALAIPLNFPAHFTYGEGLTAVGVFALDLFTFGLTTFVVCERIAIHLYEVNSQLRNTSNITYHLLVMPMMVILGSSIGAIGSFVVLNMGALASGLESMAFISFSHATLGFSRSLVAFALPIGVALGAVMGAGIAMTRPQSTRD